MCAFCCKWVYLFHFFYRYYTFSVPTYLYWKSVFEQNFFNWIENSKHPAMMSTICKLFSNSLSKAIFCHSYWIYTFLFFLQMLKYYSSSKSYSFFKFRFYRRPQNLTNSPRHLLSKTNREFFIFLKVTILENLNFKKSTILVGKHRKSSYDVWVQDVNSNLISNSLSNKMYLFIHYLHFSFFMNIEMLFIFQILMFLKKNKPLQPIQPDFVIHTKYTLYFFLNFIHLHTKSHRCKQRTQNILQFTEFQFHSF